VDVALSIAGDALDRNRRGRCSGGQNLHDPDCPVRTATPLLELGFLITLRGDHEVIERILSAILLEYFQRIMEFFYVLWRIGVLDDLRLVEVPVQDDVAEQAG